MKIQAILPIDAKDAATTAMRWLQSLTDACQSGVLQPGEYLTGEEVSELDRELALFTQYVLPKLHLSFGTNPEHKATCHLHCFRLEGEERND